MQRFQTRFNPFLSIARYYSTSRNNAVSLDRYRARRNALRRERRKKLAALSSRPRCFPRALESERATSASLIARWKKRKIQVRREASPVISYKRGDPRSFLSLSSPEVLKYLLRRLEEEIEAECEERDRF